MSVAFLSESEVICADKSGDIFLVEIDEGRSSKVISLSLDGWNPSPVRGDWRLKPINDSVFLAYSLEPGFIYCVDKKGQTLWRRRYDNVFMPLLFEGDIISSVTDADDRTEAVIISCYGQELQRIQLEVRPGPYLLAVRHGILILSHFEGPKLLYRTDKGFSLTDWYPEWQYCTMPSIYDGSDRLISWFDAGKSMAIIDNRYVQPELVPLRSIMHIPVIDPEAQPISFASNGSCIAVLFANQIIKVSDDQLSVWMKDLSTDELEASYLYIGSDCEDFIIVGYTGLALGNSSGALRSMQFEHRLTTHGLVFSHDFRRAAGGTAEGELIVVE
jgi:hypothetical protein